MLIWYADVSDMTEEQMKKYLEELSEYRLEKVNRLRYEKDKKLSVAAGILLDRALKECHLSEKDCRYQIMEHATPAAACSISTTEGTKKTCDVVSSRSFISLPVTIYSNINSPYSHCLHYQHLHYWH